MKLLKTTLLIIITLSFLSCTENKKKETAVQNKIEKKTQTTTLNPFLTFIEDIPLVELPIKSQDFQYLLIKETEDLPKDFFTYKINQEKINNDLIVYSTSSYKFKDLINSKSYKINSFIKDVSKGDIHDYTLEKYYKNGNSEDGTFFKIPILRFNVEDTYIIGFLTVLATENDVSVASIKLHTYTKEGVLLVDSESNIRDGITLIYGFSGEMGTVNIHSSISKKGITLVNTKFADEEGITKEQSTYSITQYGFELIDTK